jgi:hypothetical protein
MTCEQIGMESAPYARQMTPDVAALNDTNQVLQRRGERRMAEEAPVIAAETEAAAAGFGFRRFGRGRRRHRGRNGE